MPNNFIFEILRSRVDSMCNQETACAPESASLIPPTEQVEDKHIPSRLSSFRLLSRSFCLSASRSFLFCSRAAFSASLSRSRPSLLPPSPNSELSRLCRDRDDRDENTSPPAPPNVDSRPRCDDEPSPLLRFGRRDGCRSFGAAVRSLVDALPIASSVV